MKLNKKHIAGIVLAVLAVAAAALSIFQFGHEGEWIGFCISFFVAIVFCGLLYYMYGKKIKWCIAGFLVLYCIGLCIDTLPHYIFFHKYHNKNVVANLQDKRICFDELGGLNIMFDDNDIILNYRGREKIYEIDEIGRRGHIIVKNQIPADDMIELFGDDARRYLTVKELNSDDEVISEDRGTIILIGGGEFKITYYYFVPASEGGPGCVIFRNNLIISGGRVRDL